MNESLYPFVNHTTYDIKALSALNRLAEASVRKEKSRRTKSLCWLPVSYTHLTLPTKA